MQKNYGLDLDQERLEIRGDEEQFGSVRVPCILAIPIEERGVYRPDGEVQRGREDMMDCASRGPVNILAEKFTRGYQKKLLRPENLKWLEDNGYVANGRIDFSDAFVAINSKTSRTGNSLKAPLQAIHDHGLIPKHMLPLDPDMTFDQYHDPARITKQMVDLGKKFKEIFLVRFQQVQREEFVEELQMDFLNVAAHAWPGPVSGIYPRTELAPNHVIEIFKPQYFVFDNYIDFSNGYVKQLAADYSFHDYGYRVYVSGEGQVLEDKWAWLWTLIPQWIASIYTDAKLPVPVIVLPPRPVVVLPKANPMPEQATKFPSLDDLCAGIRDKEGQPPHDRNYRNNNPGNCRFSSVGYLPKYGVVKEDRSGIAPGKRGFAIFRDYATGWLYMKNLLIQKIQKHPTWTLYDLIGDEKEGWAPASDDNDSDAYAEYLAKRLRVDINTFRIESLVS